MNDNVGGRGGGGTTQRSDGIPGPCPGRRLGLPSEPGVSCAPADAAGAAGTDEEAPAGGGAADVSIQGVSARDVSVGGVSARVASAGGAGAERAVVASPATAAERLPSGRSAAGLKASQTAPIKNPAASTTVHRASRLLRRGDCP
ncbi:MAG TPA: hypothetical protein VE987_04170 [Polyangiaceae bacterium]|nr:hypothetical protein [Polyangiaceae bacterium]